MLQKGTVTGFAPQETPRVQHRITFTGSPYMLGAYFHLFITSVYFNLVMQSPNYYYFIIFGGYFKAFAEAFLCPR